MAQQDCDRYEFRVFSHELTHIRERLAGVARQVNADGGVIDRYVVPRATRGVNIKIRRDRLQIKVRQAREGCLELWHPSGDSPFPIEGEFIREIFNSRLGLTLDLPGDPPLDLAAFIEIVESQPSLCIANVAKDRTRFGYADEIIGEHAEVDISGWGTIETLAVECADRSTLEHFIAEHYLARYANQSYPDFLQAQLFG